MRRVMAIAVGVVVLSLVGGMPLASTARQRAPRSLWKGTLSSHSDVGEADGDARLVVVARNFVEKFIDTPPEGFSQGDETVVAAALFKPGGKRVGVLDVEDRVTFLDLDAGRARDQVTFTATLSGGQITGTGVFVSSEAELLTSDAGITGGTGRYDEVGGDLHVDFLSENAVRLIFDIEDLG